MTSSPTPAVLPDARALFLERLRSALPEWQREILDRVAASPDHYHGASFPFTAMMAAVEATATPPASDAAVPAGEVHGWKCTNCQTIFTSPQAERREADANGGAVCPYCKAHGQYTWPYRLHQGDPCTGCGLAHDDVPPGPCLATAPKVASDTGAGLPTDAQIEAVAQAIANAEGSASDSGVWPKWSDYRDHARRAIAALATPADATDAATGGGEVTVLRQALDYARDFIMSNNNKTGYCMCGSQIDDGCDGPEHVDVGDYYAKEMVETINAALATTPGGDLLEQAARVAYRICAEARHVTLGDKAAAAIRALKPAGDGGEA